MIFIYSECWSWWSSPSPSQNYLIMRNKKSYIQCTIPIPFFNWKLSYFEKKGLSDNPE